MARARKLHLIRNRNPNPDNTDTKEKIPWKTIIIVAGLSALGGAVFSDVYQTIKAKLKAPAPSPPMPGQIQTPMPRAMSPEQQQQTPLSAVELQAWQQRLEGWEEELEESRRQQSLIH